MDRTAQTEQIRTRPVRSMTGFGEAERDTSAGRLRVEIRSVNHRFLNLQIRSPNGFDRHHPEIEKVLRRAFRRGHLSVGILLDRTPVEEGATIEVDLARARGYRDGLLRIRSELGIDGEIDLRMLAAFRDLFQTVEVDRTLPEVEIETILAAVEEAAAAVQAMRETEGARLAEDLARRLDAMEREVEAIEARAPERLVAERDRLRRAVQELLEGRTEVDEERLAREIAHLAERWDIHEEVVRFRSHLALFRETLEAGSDEGVGKRFGFISQEILREANTMGSKANDATIAGHVVTLKGEIERLREQLENVE